MLEPALSERLAMIRQVIGERQRAGGWSHAVRIVAVTKTHGVEAVRAASAAGLDAVGENRVQEAIAKQDAAGDTAIAWHLIGPLQRNKARLVTGRFQLIHTVDRAELARELNQRAERRQAVLVQVNCSGEAQKHGVAPDELPALLGVMRECRNLDVQGLMTMAALTDDESRQRQAFSLLRSLRDAMRAEGHELNDLSMGMSDDYPAAVEEGATVVRLGTALFGARA